MEEKTRLFNTFESVEEAERYFGIKHNVIVEKKEDKEDFETVSNPDKFEVNYADLKTSSKCIFKHIILFTNNDNPKQNKTLKQVNDALKDLNKEDRPELHIFIAESMIFEQDDNNILNISDGKNSLNFDEINNTDTLVFSRLGVQGEENCEHIVELLQDRGYLVLNPVRYSELASNKYDTAKLLQKAEIPQPNFCLMNKEILYDEKLYNQSMENVYKEWDSKDSDKNEELKFVVKILDGHGGTGVFMIDGKKIYAILQTIFAISPDIELIIQRKEEADGGDIRVHVLTLRNKQIILGAMKRVKIGGDFRSNVSLGASAEKVKLTPEQEQIALKTAKISHLPWCAVDIMPLVKGSNKELGDNVVLEINASPGTEGISEVLNVNFINILLNELDEPKEFCLQEKCAGFEETVGVDFGEGSVNVLAKLDTGNGAHASHIEVGKYEVNDKKVKFEFNGHSYEFDIIGESNAMTGEQKHSRPIIEIPQITLGKRIVKKVPIAIVEKREKSTNMLLNRECLAWLGYMVSPDKTHVLTDEMEKLKII